MSHVDNDQDSVLDRINEAHVPEDLFGAEDVVLPPVLLKEYLQKRYRKFKDAIAPSEIMFPEERERLEELNRRLDSLYEDACQRIETSYYGLRGYGKPRPSQFMRSFSVARFNVFIGDKLFEDDDRKVFEGFLEEKIQKHGSKLLGEVQIVIAKNSHESLRLKKEVSVLHTLHQQEVPQWKHFPFVIETFEIPDQNGSNVGIIKREQDGFSLRSINDSTLYRDGVDQKHMIWMLDRILSALGVIHSAGIVYGGLHPMSVIVQPHNHNVILSDFSTAAYKPAITGERITCVNDQFCAPEVLAGKPIGPWSDLFALGKLMIWLLGGDIEHDLCPAHTEPKIAALLQRMVDQNYRTRPSDAWELFDEQVKIKDSLWERKFLHFQRP